MELSKWEGEGMEGLAPPVVATAAGGLVAPCMTTAMLDTGTSSREERRLWPPALAGAFEPRRPLALGFLEGVTSFWSCCCCHCLLDVNREEIGRSTHVEEHAACGGH